MSVLNLIRSDLLTLQSYNAGNENFKYRLHANELPWTPLSTNEFSLNQYPDLREQERLKIQLADFYQVAPEQMVLVRGSDDGIDLLMRLFLRAGIDSFMQCPPTFSMYAFFARLQQAEIINCSLDIENEFSLQVDKLVNCWQPNCKLIMLCRPNNPTGNLIDLKTISILCEQFATKSVIVIDEAYIDFAETESATSLLSSFDNLIVLRTLSKAYGLAGLRMGAVIAQPELINALQNTMPPYSLSTTAVHYALQALTDKNWFATKIEFIIKERNKLHKQLQQFPWLTSVYPSSGNFLLIASNYANELLSWLAEFGIAVRQPITNMLRLTIGSEEQNKKLLEVLTLFKI